MYVCDVYINQATNRREKNIIFTDKCSNVTIKAFKNESKLFMANVSIFSKTKTKIFKLFSKNNSLKITFFVKIL